MRNFIVSRHRSWCDRRGAALVEYGILTGLVAVVAIAAVAHLGGPVRGAFETATSELSSVLSAPAVGSPSEALQIEVMSFIMIAGSHNTEDIVGYTESAWGTLTQSDTALGEIVRFRRLPDGRVELIFRSPPSGPLADLDLVCEGLTFDLAGLAAGHTILWPSGDGPTIAEGAEHDCAFAE